jgi:two-component system phosphate regulon sensor histidine kinase PhoR
LTRKTFTYLLGLFLLLLACYSVVTALVFHYLAGQNAAGTLELLVRKALWAVLVALVVALFLADWVAGRISARLQRLVAFARRIANGDLTAHVDETGEDEFTAVEAALNQAAKRLDQDFTELENRRQELAAMLDSMQEAVVAITPEGTVRWSNAMMQRIAGTLIHPGRPLVHSVRDPEVLACVRGALERGEVCFGRANSLPSGRVFEVNASPLARGGALVVLHDVTAIEAAQKSRREFVANVSHELRTPLTSIQGYAETLIEEPNPSPEMTREFLGVILKNATRMNRLTEDLLALATVESPDYKLTPQAKPAGTLIQDAIASLTEIIADPEVELEFAGAPDCSVLADPDAMNQVFGNLIENAIKYAKAGRIRIGARRLDTEVEFTVQDFGPGIASDHLERIFERFYRVDKARSRESGGTGLGLAIVKHIVQAHGGRVWAESELGNGAAFHFTLPLAPAAEQPPVSRLN